MKRILIVNAKGGCGKTTLATNLASYYANNGLKTALMDYDPQGCCSYWLTLREQSEYQPISCIKAFSAKGVKATRSFILRAQQQLDIAIIDAPAGIKGFEFDEMLSLADVVLVPVLPTPMDAFTANNFIHQQLLPKLRIYKKPVSIVINKVKPAYLKNSSVIEQIFHMGFPISGMLHDTQAYMNCSFNGTGIFDDESELSVKEQAHWNSLLRWVSNPVDSNSIPHLSVISGQRTSSNSEDKEAYI